MNMMKEERKEKKPEKEREKEGKNGYVRLHLQRKLMKLYNSPMQFQTVIGCPDVQDESIHIYREGVLIN